jgi:hypothetical protein
LSALYFAQQFSFIVCLDICIVQENDSEDGSIGYIQSLMSFVMVAYISLVVNRWDAFR